MVLGCHYFGPRASRIPLGPKLRVLVFKRYDCLQDAVIALMMAQDYVNLQRTLRRTCILTVSQTGHLKRGLSASAIYATRSATAPVTRSTIRIQFARCLQSPATNFVWCTWSLKQRGVYRERAERLAAIGCCCCDRRPASRLTVVRLLGSWRMVTLTMPAWQSSDRTQYALPASRNSFLGVDDGPTCTFCITGQRFL